MRFLFLFGNKRSSLSQRGQMLCYPRAFGSGYGSRRWVTGCFSLFLCALKNLAVLIQLENSVFDYSRLKWTERGL
jgi:hypothetical protein